LEPQLTFARETTVCLGKETGILEPQINSSADYCFGRTRCHANYIELNNTSARVDSIFDASDGGQVIAKKTPLLSRL